MPNHGDARSLFPTAKQSAALWLAQQESVTLLTGGQTFRPVCIMKKQHVNKTHPPHPISGREKGRKTVEFTTKGTNQKCQCQLRGEPNGTTWAPVKIRRMGHVSEQGHIGGARRRFLHALCWDSDTRRGILSGSPRLTACHSVVEDGIELREK